LRVAITISVGDMASRCFVRAGCCPSNERGLPDVNVLPILKGSIQIRDNPKYPVQEKFRARRNQGKRQRIDRSRATSFQARREPQPRASNLPRQHGVYETVGRATCRPRKGATELATSPVLSVVRLGHLHAPAHGHPANIRLIGSGWFPMGITFSCLIRIYYRLRQAV
jgi:hypothetical protein